MKWLLLLLISSLALKTGPFEKAATLSPSQNAGLFDEETPLKLHIVGNIGALLADRGDKPSYHPMQLSYEEGAKKSEIHSCKLRARGNFRRQKRNCTYPPLWINFPKKAIPELSLFQGQNKLKLVMPCRGDRFLKREYMVYKLHQLLSPNSFKARMVEVVFEDKTQNKSIGPLLGFLIEAEEKLAERLEGELDKVNIYRPKQMEKTSFLEMAVFEYLIGNTDWSVQYKHNVKTILLGESKEIIPVAYDFDHAGLVSAPYAKPAEALEIASVRDRRYRGYCPNGVEQELDAVIERFSKKREEIYALYQNATLLDEKDKKFCIKFLQKFFAIIDNEKKRKRAFNYPCTPFSTANVVIRGLNK